MGEIGAAVIVAVGAVLVLAATRGQPGYQEKPEN